MKGEKVESKPELFCFHAKKGTKATDGNGGIAALPP